MKSSVVDVLAAVFLLAVVYILVKPGSLAPGFIRATGNALDGIVSYAVNG